MHKLQKKVKKLKCVFFRFLQMGDVNLSNFPMLDRELNEILYDHLDNNIKPEFSTSFYKKTVQNENDDESQIIELVRIVCLKCCKIIKNDNFRPSNNQRPWKKQSSIIELTNSQEFKRIVHEATRYEWIDEKKKVHRGNYSFAQLTKQQKFIATNKLFEQQEIPEYFHQCVNGECL